MVRGATLIISENEITYDLITFDQNGMKSIHAQKSQFHHSLVSVFSDQTLCQTSGYESSTLSTH